MLFGALSFGYLDGRRQNYFALSTSLNEIRKSSPQLASERDTPDADARTANSNNYRRKILDTSVVITDVYDPLWLKFHHLQAIVMRDLAPYNLWLSIISSRLSSHMSALTNAAIKYGWNWVLFCVVVMHVRRTSGVTQSSPGEMLREWQRNLLSYTTPLHVVTVFNDLLPALPDQLSDALLDVFQATFTAISPSLWPHISHIRRPSPGFSVSL